MQELHDRKERLFILTDAERNAYAQMVLTPYIASVINKNLDDQSSPYQWLEAGQS